MYLPYYKSAKPHTGRYLIKTYSDILLYIIQKFPITASNIILWRCSLHFDTHQVMQPSIHRHTCPLINLTFQKHNPAIVYGYSPRMYPTLDARTIFFFFCTIGWCSFCSMAGGQQPFPKLIPEASVLNSSGSATRFIQLCSPKIS